MLNYQGCDHLTAVSLSAGNGFVVSLWSLMGNTVAVSGHCREALSAFQAQREGIQGVWKLLFPFSQQLLPRHLLYQCQCWTETFVLHTLHGPAGHCRTATEKFLGPLWKKCPPQCWPNPPSPLAHLGAEILSWQQALFHVRALSAVTLLEELLGLDNWLFWFLLLRICSEAGPAGWYHCLAAGLWSLALLWLAFAGDTFLSGFAW